jgi:hypothetical protein
LMVIVMVVWHSLESPSLSPIFWFLNHCVPPPPPLS